MLVFNRFLTSCLPVFLALIPLTAFADMALLMKEENSGFVPNYLFRQMSCRIEATRVIWSASLYSEGDLKLGGIENGRFFYNESEAANALRFMIDSLCGTMPESENLIK